MADLPFDRELDAEHAQQRRDERRVEDHRRARAAAARDDLLAAAATPTGAPPRTQRLRGRLSVGEDLALERAAKASGLAVATFSRAAILHFVARLDPPRSEERSDSRQAPPPIGRDRSAPRHSEPSQLERVVGRAALESVRTGEPLDEAIERIAEEERKT